MTAAVVQRSAPGCSIAQRIRYEYSAPVTNLRQRLVVVPPALHGRQQRVDWRLEIRGAEGEIVRAGADRFGNHRIDLAVASIDAWVEFDVRTTVVFSDDHPEARLGRVKRYLLPTRLTAPDEGIALLVARAGGGGPETICAEVRQALTYEHDVTGVHTTAAEALVAARGVCQDFAHVMVAACRLAGRPARYVSGHLLGEGGSHAWVEVLVPDPARGGSWRAEGWDPTHGRRTDDSYITIATGRDYADVAPMSGTFDGDAVGRLSVQKRAVADG